MKNIALLSAAFGLAAATQHRHGHQHIHEKKDATATADVTFVAGPTVIMYSLNGVTISEDEVMEGIKNGTFIWANGAPAVASSSSETFSASSTVYSSSATTFSKSYATSTSVSVSSTEASSSSSAAASSTSSSSSSSSSSSASDIGTTFPDGEIDCGDFDSVANYGAVAVDYLGLGGWTGIQNPTETVLQGFADILTIASGDCTDGSCCNDGYYCSYACPAGYQKSQWPTTQGSTGQSVGGLLCKNGKLYKTNEDFDTICITGASDVTVLVRNEMGEDAAVCRTDYPGM